MSDGRAEQLALWVDGQPVHNKTKDECTPDFSCCEPELLWPELKRREFAGADETVRGIMLAAALADLTALRTTEAP